MAGYGDLIKLYNIDVFNYARNVGYWFWMS